PECGSSANTCCTSASSPKKDLRMSVGRLYAKIRRDGELPPHTSYRLQRSTTPPGSESSSAADESNASAPVATSGSSTKRAASGGDGATRSRCCQRVNVERGIFSRRQNASAESPLASHFSKTRRHSAALRFTRPSARTRIDASLLDGVRSTTRAAAGEERRGLAAYDYD